MKVGLALAVVVSLAGSAQAQPVEPTLLPEPQLVQSTRWVMGTHLRIAVVGTAPDSLQAALDACFAEVERWNDLLSNYDPGSPLSQVNARSGEWVDVPVDLFRYLDRSVADADRTQRAFDITVGGWTRATGGTEPVVGIRWLQLRDQGGHYQARLRRRGMALDPGGNGKGVALDAAAIVLANHGIADALFDFGGSSWLALGTPPVGLSWDIDIADPSGQIVGTMRLVDRALSISASMQRDQASEEGEAAEPRPHIVDPRTLDWITDDRVVAVVSPSATDAEVLSTALVVMGADGVPLLARYEEAGSVVLEAGVEPVVTSSAEAWFVPR